jgi:hypothetical protein
MVKTLTLNIGAYGFDPHLMRACISQAHKHFPTVEPKIQAKVAVSIYTNMVDLANNTGGELTMEIPDV